MVKRVQKARNVIGMTGAGLVIAGSMAVTLALVVATGLTLRALSLGVTAAEWRRMKKRGKA